MSTPNVSGDFAPAQVVRGGAEVGDLAVHKSGDVVILDRRKDDDTGWWLDRHGGLADVALAGPDWVLVKRYVARDAVSKGWRRPHVDSWQAGQLAECEGGSRHEASAVHVIVRATCGAAFMSTDGGIALQMAAQHAQHYGSDAQVQS